MKLTSLPRSPFSLIICFCLICTQSHCQSSFSRAEIFEDLEYLRSTLENTHYDLYAYTSEEDFTANYELQIKWIDNDSLDLLEATNLFQRVVSAADNGHTEINFPGSSYMMYAQNGGTILPIELAFEDGKALIRKNWSDANIQVGSEMISINKMTMNEVLSKIYPQLSAERAYFKNAKIEMYSFPRMYWQAFGQVDTFELLISTNGEKKEYTIEAPNLVEGYELKRDGEVIDLTPEFRFYDHAAYLKPPEFSGDEDYFQSYIDSCFTELDASGKENLILDLRNNPGGDDWYSDYVVSYFADRPFKWYSNFRLKTSEILKEDTRANFDTTEAYWSSILSHKSGETYEYDFGEYEPQPEEKRFSGVVYVLVNRLSYSMATVMAAQIQDYGFGTIVGEETGEYPSLYAAIFQFSLPNTGIIVKVAKGRITRVNGDESEKGLIPDIIIRDHLLDEKDEILEELLNSLTEN